MTLPLPTSVKNQAVVFDSKNWMNTTVTTADILDTGFMAGLNKIIKSITSGHNLFSNDAKFQAIKQLSETIQHLSRDKLSSDKPSDIIGFVRTRINENDVSWLNQVLENNDKIFENKSIATAQNASRTARKTIIPIDSNQVKSSSITQNDLIQAQVILRTANRTIINRNKALKSVLEATQSLLDTKQLKHLHTKRDAFNKNYQNPLPNFVNAIHKDVSDYLINAGTEERLIHELASLNGEGLDKYNLILATLEKIRENQVSTTPIDKTAIRKVLKIEEPLV